MTPASAPDPIRLTGPDALVAAVPYLLGFTPQNSAVVVWATAGSGSDGSRPSAEGHHIAMCMRVDLPEPRHGARGARALGDCVAGPVPNVPDDAEPFVLVYPDGAEEPSSDSSSDSSPADAPDGSTDAPALPRADLAAAMAQRLAEAGRRPLDVLCVRGTRWWSYECSDAECCPPGGNELDPRVADEVSASFVLAGRAPLSSRGDLVVELAPAPAGPRRRMRALITGTGCDTTSRTAPLAPILRTRCWDALARLAAEPAQVTLDDLALVLVGLRDVRLRDGFLAVAARRPDPAVTDALARAVRLAPRGFVAGAAATLGTLRYFEGDGARAWVALDRARASDPRHSLTALVSAALGRGMPPRELRDALAGLDPDDLRDGGDGKGASGAA